MGGPGTRGGRREEALLDQMIIEKELGEALGPALRTVAVTTARFGRETSLDGTDREPRHLEPVGGAEGLERACVHANGRAEERRGRGQKAVARGSASGPCGFTRLHDGLL